MEPPTEQSVRRVVLPNGLTILVEEMDSVRSASMGFWVRTGSADEPAEKSGVTHFIEHLLFRRTETRTNREISSLIDRLGGDVDAFTSKENTAFYARVEGRRVEETLDLLADIVRSPVFDPDDLEKERQVILEEISMVEDSPEELLQELFVNQLWPAHPLGRAIGGTPAIVEEISVADVASVYRRQFVPRNLIFAAAGAVDADWLIQAVTERFGDLRGELDNRELHAPRPVPHLAIKTRKEMEQVHVLMGFGGLPSGHELRFATSLLNTVLGGGMSSRLFTDLREEKGLVYSCGSFSSSYREAGFECLWGACRPARLEAVLRGMADSVRRMVSEQVSAEELNRAKESVVSSYLIGLESTVRRMSALARNEFHFGKVQSIAEVVEAIEGVSAEQVEAAARLLFDPSSLSLGLIGPVTESPLSLEELRDALAG